ncbi:MAG: NRDE family protein [Saprospirales bacterium]|jgi:hypothetical protein|nr:NRDE family protein [Saprospirales bacterium]MBK8921736.1 NRDE family protein [Saprospirales bacterium]
MCTVTYLPYRQGFILTHNRDEAPTRSPQVISRGRSARATTLLFPKDTKAGGAWIVAARDGRVACLLNGAFVKHRHQPPYRRSRGLVLLDFFDWPDADTFFTQYDLDQIEPFTFLYFHTGRVLEFRWDGSRRHLAERLPHQPHFWCSATLYPPQMQAVREQVFRDWLQARADRPTPIRPASVFNLHLTGSVGDTENNYVMNRSGRVCTVSVTQAVRKADGSIRMRYSDLLDGRRHRRQIQAAAVVRTD